MDKTNCQRSFSGYVSPTESRLLKKKPKLPPDLARHQHSIIARTPLTPSSRFPPSEFSCNTLLCCARSFPPSKTGPLARMNQIRFVIAGEPVHHETRRVARVRAGARSQSPAGRGFRRRGRFGYAAHAASHHDRSFTDRGDKR